MARVSWQHQRLRGQREELVQAVVEKRGPRSRFLLIGMQIWTPDTGEKERISCEDERMVEQVAGAFHRMAWRVESRKRQVRGCTCVAIAHSRKGK